MIESIWAQILIGGFFCLIGALVGPAFGRVTLVQGQGKTDLRTIRSFALSSAPRSPSRSRSATSASTMPDSDRLVVWGVSALAIISLYLKFRTEVIVTLAILAISIICAATISLILMSRRGVVAENRRTYGTLVCLVGAFIVGIVCVVFLWSPPVGSPLLESAISQGAEDKITGLLFVAYQILGAGAFLLVALLSIGFCVALLAALNLYKSSAGKWLWRLLFRYTSFAWSGGTIIPGTLLALLSILFTGGWMFDWVSTLGESNTLSHSLHR